MGTSDPSISSSTIDTTAQPTLAQLQNTTSTANKEDGNNNSNSSNASSHSDSMSQHLSELKDIILSYERETNSETKQKVNEACIDLIHLLPSNSALVQLSILRQIIEIKNENLRIFQKLFVDNSQISISYVLVDLLSSPHPKVKEYSYSLLTDLLKDQNALALEDDIIKLLPKLIVVLSPKSDSNNSNVPQDTIIITKTQIHALQLILLISYKVDSLILFKKYNLLLALKPYLLIHNYLIKQKTCEILINMSYEGISVINDIFDCDLLAPLVAIISIDPSVEPQMQDGVNIMSLQLCALCVLANISRGSIEQNMVIVSSGILLHLHKFLQSPNVKIRESSAATISNLSRESAYIMDLLVKHKYSPTIFHILEDQQEILRVKKHLIRFLGNLAKGTEKQRRIIANYKIISVLEPILVALNSEPFHSGQIDLYSSILDICLHVIVHNKYQKKYFFTENILNLLFPILTVKHANETISSKEKHLMLKKNFVKFLLMLSKNAREFNYEMLANARVMDKLILVLNDVSKVVGSPASPSLNSNNSRNGSTDTFNSYTDFGKSQSQIFDILTIIYSISVNCKQDTTQKQIIIQKFDLFKLLLKYTEYRYNFKIRYISCELLTIMFKFEKEISQLSDGNISFYQMIDIKIIEQVVNNFNRENNGAEIDLQLISLILFICLKDNNKKTLSNWFDHILKTRFLDKLISFNRSISINNSSNYPTLINIIIILYTLFKLKNRALMALIKKEQLTLILDFFKNIIGILTTKKDEASFKTTDLTVRAVKEFANISVKEKQIVLNCGMLGILTLYLYSFSSANNLKLLPLVLETFAAIAAGDELQKTILCTKYNILPLLLSIFTNNDELMNNITVKANSVLVLDNLTNNASVKIYELVYKLGLSNNLIDMLDERIFDNETKNHMISALANLASGSEYQKEEQIIQGVLMPVFDILQYLVKPNTATPISTVSESAPMLPSPRSVTSSSNISNSTSTTDSKYKLNSRTVSRMLLNNILRLLSNLSSGNPKQSLQIINAGFLPLLFEIISYNDIIIIEKAARLIRNISNGGISHCKAIIANYLIIPLNSLLSNNNKLTVNSQPEPQISELDFFRLKKMLDIHVLWTFANVSRFEDSERLTTLNSGVLLSLPKLMSLKIANKDDKNLQKAIISLLNNLIMSKECVSIIVYDHSELIVFIITLLLGHTTARDASASSPSTTDRSSASKNGKGDSGHSDNVSNDDKDDAVNDLIVLILNFMCCVSKVEDIKYRRFLVENDLLFVVNNLKSSPIVIVRALSLEISNNLKGFEGSRKKIPST